MIEEIRYDEKGLIPAIAQDAESGEVLMTAFMNREALERTLETRVAHYWSRSRGKIWKKGETSGHIQKVHEIRFDCDSDAILLKVHQDGVACHTGHRSCFYRAIGDEMTPRADAAADTSALLDRLYEVIMERKLNPPAEKSYVASLFAKGQDSILKKIGEEAGEVIIASKNRKEEEIIYETADLWFHSLVALAYHGIQPGDVLKELGRRYGKSGVRE